MIIDTFDTSRPLQEGPGDDAREISDEAEINEFIREAAGEIEELAGILRHRRARLRSV